MSPPLYCRNSWSRKSTAGEVTAGEAWDVLRRLCQRLLNRYSSEPYLSRPGAKTGINTCSAVSEEQAEFACFGTC